jgi:hypothetical protein
MTVLFPTQVSNLKSGKYQSAHLLQTAFCKDWPGHRLEDDLEKWKIGTVEVIAKRFFWIKITSPLILNGAPFQPDMNKFSFNLH